MKTSCPKCKEQGLDFDDDNLIIYPNGGMNCFACGYNVPSNCNKKGAKIIAEEGQDLLQGDYKALIHRGISEETCRDNNYMVLEIEGGTIEIAQYTPLIQKLRYQNKTFEWKGRNGQPVSMFGLYNSNLDYSKPLFITEGEIDKLSINECGYQAVSVTDGASSIERNIRQDRDELLKFKHLVLFLDNDKSGQEATKKALELLPKDNVNVINCPEKDANALLLSHPETLKCILNEASHEIIPEGLVFGQDLDIEKLKTTNIRSIPLPWPLLNASMMGLEYGCLYLFLAGTSVGKSSLLRELVYFYRNTQSQLKIANLFLEENEDVTPLAFAAIHNNIPLGMLRRNRALLSDEKWEEIHQLLNTDHLTFINSRFNKSADNILKQIEYLVVEKKYDLIIIDHISYIIGRTGISKHGERRDVDEFIYALQDLVQRLGCIVVAVSHVNESAGTKRWDEGEIPNIYSGRSSRVLAQVPDGIIGLARNLTNPNKCDILNLYNLKNRWFSKLGKCDELHYITETGRLQTTIDIFGIQDAEIIEDEQLLLENKNENKPI